MMLTRASSYDAQIAGFAWDLPDRLNMAHQVCDAWVAKDPDRVAIVELADSPKDWTYRALDALSRRVQSALLARGTGPGDRVGVLLSQSALCAAAHIAIWRMGAVSVPLFTLFGQNALATRIAGAGARVTITDADGAARVRGLGAEALTADQLTDHKATGPALTTGPETPACLIFTSGTTGAPKGALHGHRMLTGHLPGVILSHDYLGQRGDRLWTPADWAWIGGLFDLAMPGLALGVPVVAARLPRFDGDACARVIRQTGARNIFFPPTALRMLKAADARLPGLRSVASGGEPLGPEMLAWGRDALGLAINEFYGQTECNMVATSCSALFPARPGSIGRAVPGFDVAVLDPDGQPTGSEGDIVIRRGAASMMLGYLDNPAATAAKFRGDWMLTGDRGTIDAGYITFLGREDDVITSAGYRIGPAEIEDCLLTHPAVATVGVVGKPDALRTQIVKAYVVPKPGQSPAESDLQDWVKSRLAAHAYPREVAFLDALPMTVTGKVVRKDLRARAAAEAIEEGQNR